MIIDGKKIADQILKEIQVDINNLKGRSPCLSVILVGEDPASQIYVRRKAQASQKVGIRSIKKEFPETISEEVLLDEITRLNNDSKVDGILVQLPLPSHINTTKVTRTIDPFKDVDGFHPTNIGKLLIGDSDGFIPCTPLGVQVLLERSAVDMKEKHIVIIGRSNIVGKPLAALMMQSFPGCNSTVTVAHRFSTNLREFTQKADILIVAVGIRNFITDDMIKEGAVIIDIGINKVENPEHPRGYYIVGDVDFENVKEKCSLITPVPGGVGPITIAMLLQNTLKSYRNRFLG